VGDILDILPRILNKRKQAITEAYSLLMLHRDLVLDYSIKSFHVKANVQIYFKKNIGESSLSFNGSI